MGIEAQCTVQVGRKVSAGTALLEGEVLIFRGDFRLEIPFDRIREVATDGDTLVVSADEQARFELGAQIADRWMKLIKQPKGLFEKLEIGPQVRVAVVDVTDSLFLSALRERVANLAEGRVPEGAAVIFFGAETREALRKMHVLRTRMAGGSALWVVRPKATKAISEADVLEAVREAGLVDTKVVAFSKTHTAHKCVIPLELRGQSRRRPPIVTIPPSDPELVRKVSASASPKGSATKTDRPVGAPPAASKKAGLKPRKPR